MSGDGDSTGCLLGCQGTSGGAIHALHTADTNPEAGKPEIVAISDASIVAAVLSVLCDETGQ